MADQAVDTDRTVILQPMPPHERRVVHVALYDDSRVATESIYEGERRRVTIVPKE
jgi:spoIIIJ-associated protein